MPRYGNLFQPDEHRWQGDVAQGTQEDFALWLRTPTRGEQQDDALGERLSAGIQAVHDAEQQAMDRYLGRFARYRRI
jgi:hypothetical protein